MLSKHSRNRKAPNHEPRRIPHLRRVRKRWVQSLAVTMDAPPVNEWILGPIDRAVLFVGEEAKVGGLLQRALIHIEKGRPLLELAAKHLRAKGGIKAADPIQRLLQAAPVHEQWAMELRETDYALLNAHSLVAIWGALEVCVEDIVVAILARDPGAIASVSAAGVRFDSNKLSSPLAEEDLRILYRKIEDVVRVKHDVVQTQENVLNIFGLSAACPGHKDALLSANALRNAIVHRGGIIDDKAVRQAPALAPQLGAKCIIKCADFLRYHEAVSACLVALVGSVVASPYVVRNAS